MENLDPIWQVTGPFGCQQTLTLVPIWLLLFLKSLHIWFHTYFYAHALDEH
jgi:hypothetical protein